MGKLHFFLSTAQSIYLAVFFFSHCFHHYLFSLHLSLHSLSSCSPSTVHTVPLFLLTSFCILCSFVCLYFHFFLPFIHPQHPLSQPPFPVYSFLPTFISPFVPSFTAFLHTLTHPLSACLFTLPPFPLHFLPWFLFCRHYHFLLDEMQRHNKSSQQKFFWVCWEH